MEQLNGNNNKETFRLLQLSDDLKSLSDLELELKQQRKKKVRRKTRHRSVSTSRLSDTENINKNECNIITLWIALFLGCCWLLTLSYMISVIHSENLRLEVQFQKLSVTSQNLPGALQKWHETTKFLQENQTIIFERIQELQKNFFEMQKNLSILELKVNEKKDSSNNEKYVAQFGAQIRAMSVDVDSVKEKLSQYQTYKNDINKEIETIKSNISNLTVPVSNNKTNVNYSEEITQLKDKIFNDIKSLKFNITIVNDTLSQKTKILNDELVIHKSQIDEFLERSANATSHVKSIEDDWTKHKDIILNWDSNRVTLTSEISSLKNISAHLEISIQDINGNLNKFRNEVDQNFLQIKRNQAKTEMDNIVNTGKTSFNDITVKNDNNKDISNDNLNKNAALDDLLKNRNSTSNDQEQKNNVISATSNPLPIVNQTESVVNMR